MRSFPSTLLALAATLAPVSAQTFTKCNPLDSTCPSDPALGKSTTIDFTSGESNQFTASESPAYDSSGAHFTVAKSGDAPTLTSTWYLMFGRIDVTMQAAPGTGIVSTVVLQSDDLDEIDFEWLGGDDTQVQSNYFGKGNTATYDRGAFHPNPGNHDGLHTYSVDWTADAISWIIDGTTVRTLTSATADANQYPQTPMQLKLGIWAGGDPSNAPGTIQWAGGPVNYAGGPYTMTIKSVKATDYSTGTSYSYGDTSGSWQSIRSSGGQIHAAGDAGSPAPPAQESVTEESSGAPTPFGGTHRDTSSVEHPSVWPWVASGTAAAGASATETQPGLPSGWSVSASGKVVAPSSAASTPAPTSPYSPPPSSPASSSGGSNGGGIVVTAAPSTLETSTAAAAATGSTVPIATGGAPAPGVALGGVVAAVLVVAALLM